MLKFLIFLTIFIPLVVGSSSKFRLVNGQQIGRIIDGKVENPGTFPYVVYLRTIKYFTKYDLQSNKLLSYVSYGKCGGSIIRSDIILTAAHCVLGVIPKNVTAFAGIVHTFMKQPSAQFIHGRRIVRHEHYQQHWKNDIALVFLLDKFTISEYVSTISLGNPLDYRAGMNVTAVGWGRDVNGQSPDWLFRGDFVMFGRLSCAYTVGYFDQLLCAIDPNISQKICSGDSGGPLVVNNVLVGISAGTFEPDDGRPTNGSCDPTRPAVFTNVSYYRSWINTKIAYDNLYFR